MVDSNKIGRTKAIPGDPDGHNDLRVIFSADGKTILHDERSKGEQKSNSEK